MHIEHNMDNVVDLRVHIAPVGYEEDRIVIPAVQKKADRVWLLVHSNPSEDRALQFTERITKKLENAKIQVVSEPHDRTNFFQIIKCVKSIIDREKKNTLYVNLASGSKIQSIALMMGCMTFNDRQNIRPFSAVSKLCWNGKCRLWIKNIICWNIHYVFYAIRDLFFCHSRIAFCLCIKRTYVLSIIKRHTSHH